MYKGLSRQIVSTMLLGLLGGGAYAMAPGFYMGLMLGPATNNSSSSIVDTSTTGGLPATGQVLANPKSNQFGSRYFMGYKMNQYAGFEGGFNFFTKIKYDTKGQQSISDPQVAVRDIDLMGRLSLPFDTPLDVFAEGGVALEYRTQSGSFQDIFEPPSAANPLGRYKSVSETKFAPIIGVGATYDLNQNWMLTASWIRLMAGSFVGNMDFYGLGLSYHFTSKYCGQFLCDD